MKTPDQEIAELLNTARQALSKAKDIADEHHIYFVFAETFISNVALPALPVRASYLEDFASSGPDYSASYYEDDDYELDCVHRRT